MKSGLSASIVRVPLTGRLVLQLQAKGHDEGEETFEKRLAIPKQLKVRRFVSAIDGHGAVFAGPAVGVAHGASSDQMVGAPDDPTSGNTCRIARGSRRRRGFT